LLTTRAISYIIKSRKFRNSDFGEIVVLKKFSENLKKVLTRGIISVIIPLALER